MIRSQPRVAIRGAAGFSLIELMIALVAGLVVIGAVLAFTVSSVKANSDFVKSARLMQELRNTSDYVTSELKRAGYDEAAMDYVSNPSVSAVSKFSPMLVDTSDPAKNCIIYAYDRQPGTPGGVDLDNGEVRAIRRSTTTMDGQTIGVIEVAESTSTITPVCNGNAPDYANYPTTCNTASGWCPLSDPRVIDVSAFTVSTAKTDTSGGYSRGVQTIPGSSGFNAMQLRELEVTMTGNLRNDVAINRSVKANIKVRADCLRANVAACNAAPTP
jgi:Tfp pilus assembly protein PilW